MNVQEQIEKAWRAGFEKAMNNAYNDDGAGSPIYSLMGSEYTEALNKYLNKQALLTAENDGVQ